MRTLAAASAVSVLCTVPVWLFVVPQLVSSGMVEPGPLFELMVLLPTPIGLIAALVGAVARLCALVRRGVPVDVARRMVTFGQIATVSLAVAIAVAAGLFTAPWFGVDEIERRDFSAVRAKRGQVNRPASTGCTARR
ncbi:hypothetical protein [Rhodococcus sp. ACT016]|uniref:hypothetical protein n=1 Tax=Rhodococcus sp. ACT016 TaxID=3134808 RepID=UPI003D2C3420